MKRVNLLAMAFAILVVRPAVILGQDAFSLPEARVGAAYEFSIPADGGLAPLKWKVAAGELPPGIELLPSGILHGIPTTPLPDAYQFMIEVADSSQPSQTFTQHFLLVVKAAQLRMALGGNNSVGANSPLKIVTPKTSNTPAASVTSLPSGTSAAPTPTAGAPGGVATAGGGDGGPSGGSPAPTPAPAAPGGQAGAVAAVAPSPAPSSAGDACQDDISDCRDDFVASAYLGLAIDTFASGETRLYLNPNAPSGPKERMVGGIDFGYRLMGKPKPQTNKWPNQLWVYGETVHGVRSTDVDCSKNATFLTCQTALAIPNRPADQILYTFRNATSLEGFAGFRYEFVSLQPGSPANLYVKTQVGFLTVAGAPSAAKAIHHVGLGAITTKGDFQGSYLEVGYGRNDLFAQHRLSRWKVDAYLSRRVRKGISFFAQINVDTDIGPGADSIQSYLGFDFDLRRFKDWFK